MLIVYNLFTNTKPNSYVQVFIIADIKTKPNHKEDIDIDIDIDNDNNIM